MTDTNLYKWDFSKKGGKMKLILYFLFGLYLLIFLAICFSINNSLIVSEHLLGGIYCPKGTLDIHSDLFANNITSECITKK